MPSRPLEYQSLKTVLQLLDANIRFQISLRMPSIREVEKMLPLKIKRLDMDNGSTEINETSYLLGVVRYCPDGNTPQSISGETDWCGSGTDYDEFGFSVPRNNVLLPGDISFQDGFDDDFNTEAVERMYREELRVQEKALEIKKELEREEMTVREYLRSLTPLGRDEYGEERRIREAIHKSYEHLTCLIDRSKLELLPFDCRRNNTRPPFAYSIQLNITRNNRNTTTERFEYNKKLFEASKHLHEVLFGGRPMPILVDHFHFNAYGGICRLPTGFRLRVNNVHADIGAVSHRNFPLLVENSDNLDTLSMYFMFDRNVAQSQIVRNTKKIEIVFLMVDEIQEKIQTIRTLSNREISILTTGENFSPENYYGMMEAWSLGDRPIGSSCSMRIRGKEVIRKVLNIVLTRNETAEKTYRCVTIRQDNFTKIEVVYSRYKGPRTDHYENGDWILKIRIDTDES